MATSPTVSASTAKERRSTRRIPPLENGDQLSTREFLRRYEAMPEVKKAELINGIVFMASPVRVEEHGEPDNLLQGWLCNYCIATPGVRAATNSTIRLSPDDAPQPDGLLRILREHGGRGQLDPKGYLVGAPELVLEIAASSASIDLRDKLTAYRRAGVLEYLVWRTEDQAVNWWVLEDDEYRPLESDADAVICSQVFPGLRLDISALLAGDGAQVMAKLQEGLQSTEHSTFVAELSNRAKSPPSTEP